MGKAFVILVFVALVLIARFLVGWVVILIDESELSPFVFFNVYPVGIALLVSLTTYLVAIRWLYRRTHYALTGVIAAATAVAILLPNAMKLGPKIAVYATTMTALEWLVIGTVAHIGTEVLIKRSLRGPA